MTLPRFFEHAYRSMPERLAFRIRTNERIEELTYGALFARAERFAAGLHAGGLVPGGNVIIILPHSGDLLCAFAGAVVGGFVPAVLPPPSNRQDPNVFWAQIAEMARVTAGAPIVTSGELRATLPAGSPLRSHPFVVPDALPEMGAAPHWHRPQPGDTAFLQYSSGTTGLRKGVQITHAMFDAQVESYRRALGIVDGDRVASWLPLYHDMGLVACFLEAIAMGLPATLIDPFLWVGRPGILFEEIASFRATHVWLPNFAFNHLAQTVKAEPPHDLRSIKAFINCSEPCKIESFDAFRAAFAAWGIGPEKLLTCYAMAESVFAVTQSAPNRPVRVLQLSRTQLLDGGRAVPSAGDESALPIVSVGRLLEGLSLRVTSDDGIELPDGTVGEIELRGAMVTAGYLNNSVATAAAFRGDWFRTGDLGFWLDGELYITGRKKDVLIVHGRNYYAHDIEALVSAFPEIKRGRVVAFGLTNEQSGSENLVIVAERSVSGERGDAALLRRKIKATIAETLGVSAAGIAFVPAGWIVKTTSGKVDRENNRKKYVEFNS